MTRTFIHAQPMGTLVVLYMLVVSRSRLMQSPTRSLSQTAQTYAVDVLRPFAHDDNGKLRIVSESISGCP